MFPELVFEEGFKEEDELWRMDLRETDEAIDKRSKVVLDKVFEADGRTWLSITSHSGEIASILRGKYFLPSFVWKVDATICTHGG